MIEMHGDGDMRIRFDSAEDEVPQKCLTGVLSGTPGGLDNNRAVDGIGGLHDRDDLFQIIDIERRNAEVVFGRVVKQQAHWNKGHRAASELI